MLTSVCQWRFDIREAQVLRGPCDKELLHITGQLTALHLLISIHLSITLVWLELHKCWLEWPCSNYLDLLVSTKILRWSHPLSRNYFLRLLS